MTADDVREMVTHWLLSRAGGRFGTTYGNSLPDRLFLSQHGPGIEAELGKLSRDVPYIKGAAVDAWSRPAGVDGMDVVITVDSIAISAAEARAVALPSPSTGASVTLIPSAITLPSTGAGHVIDYSSVAQIAVTMGGVDITAQCSIVASDSAGVSSTTTAAGLVTIINMVDSAVTGAVDFTITGPFDGSLTARLSITKTAQVDPLAAMVVLASGFNGAAGSVLATDESGLGHTLVAAGGASIVADAGAGDNLSARVPAGNAYFAASGADLAIAGRPFCVEFRMSIDNVAAAWCYYLSAYSSGSSAGEWLWFYTYPGGMVRFYYGGRDFNVMAAPTSGVKHHFAITRAADANETVSLWMDGALIGTESGIGLTPPSGVPSWFIGGTPSSVSSGGAGCNVDWFRLTVGSPRYTAPFTPPINPF